MPVLVLWHVNENWQSLSACTPLIHCNIFVKSCQDLTNILQWIRFLLRCAFRLGKTVKGCHAIIDLKELQNGYSKID